MKTKLVTLLLLFFCLSAMADDPRTHLVIWAKDGSKIVYPLGVKPQVLLTETELVLRLSGHDIAYDKDEILRFTYEPAGLSSCTLMLQSDMVTFCSLVDLDFSQVSKVKAYVADSYDPDTGILTLGRVEKVPAGTGVLLIGEPGKVDVPFILTDEAHQNLLKGVTFDTEITPTDGDYTNYILVNGSHGKGFYRLSAPGVLAAGKAYLQLPTNQARQAIGISYEDGNTTIITEIPVIDEDKEGTFTLDGIRKKNATKQGVYIMEGKKVIVK